MISVGTVGIVHALGGGGLPGKPGSRQPRGPTEQTASANCDSLKMPPRKTSRECSSCPGDEPAGLVSESRSRFVLGTRRFFARRDVAGRGCKMHAIAGKRKATVLEQ
jgi:hypothetical protein